MPQAEELSRPGEAVEHLGTFDGVMLGRAAYQTPWLLAEVDRQVFGTAPSVASPREALEAYLPYVEEVLARVRTQLELKRVLLINLPPR